MWERKREREKERERERERERDWLRAAVEEIEVHELESNALSLLAEEAVLTAQVLRVNSRICRAEELTLSFLVAIYGVTACCVRGWRTHNKWTYSLEWEEKHQNKSIHQNDEFWMLSALRYRSIPLLNDKHSMIFQTEFFLMT